MQTEETLWKFEDPPNAATVTTSFVLEGSDILRAYHDFEGGWQFHGSPDQPSTTDVARLVALKSVIDLDTSLMELHDLPYGWCATRESKTDKWFREKNNPFPTFEENGYYLEDAVWISEYIDDINPPTAEIRENLTPQTYAKLLFRFAAEDAERAGGQTERMWVIVQAMDEDGYYVGTLDNDPHHGDVIQCGAQVHFHSSHVMSVDQ